MGALEDYDEAVAAVTGQHTVDTKTIHLVRAGTDTPLGVISPGCPFP